MTLLALISMLALSAAEPATAPQPTTDSPWAVQEVVVRAPATRLWKLSKGGSTVYVLGTVEPLQRGLAWNRAPLERIMGKANRLIIPPYASASLFGVIGADFQGLLPHGQSLDAELPDDLRERLHAVLSRIGQRPQAFNRNKAGMAAFHLNMRFRASSWVTAREPMDTLRQLAAHKRVPVQEAAHYDAAPMLKELTTVPEDRGILLLRRAVDATEYQLSHTSEISAAWARGDLHALRETLGPDATPVGVLQRGAVNTTRAFNANSDRDAAAAIEAALALPGVSVTFFDLRAFAVKGGLIDRLRAEGVEVTEPEE
jgi:uncharacterized protein YbaP (TraB family)